LKSDFAAKTNLAISSTEFCQALFDESQIGIRYGGGSGHEVMIPLLEFNISVCRAKRTGIASGCYGMSPILF
jgi:hypothetical protein